MQLGAKAEGVRGCGPALPRPWPEIFVLGCPRGRRQPSRTQSMLTVHWRIITHTHIHLMALCLGLPKWACTRKLKPIWILLKLETVSGSGISWAMCKPAPRSRQMTMPAPHPSVFLQAECFSCHPTNSIIALKAHCRIIARCISLMFGNRKTRT